MGPYGIVLEDDAQRALVGRDHYLLRRRRLRYAADLYRARVGRLKAGDHAEHDRLAASRGAEQREALAVLYGQVEILVDDFGAVGLAHMFDFYFSQSRQLLSLIRYGEGLLSALPRKLKITSSRTPVSRRPAYALYLPGRIVSLNFFIVPSFAELMFWKSSLIALTTASCGFGSGLSLGITTSALTGSV